MDSVRFSMIEDDIRWENEHKQNRNQLLLQDKNEKYTDDDDDDDKRSISSESSCEGLEAESAKCLKNSSIQSNDSDLWQINEVDEALRELPNADAVLDILNSGQLDQIVIGSEDVNTAILLTILMGRTECVLKLLNNFYANANAIDGKGRAALHLACSTGNLVIAKALLDQGADANRWDYAKKITPLHCAASASSVECIQLLLRRGASVNAGIEKRSALHVATEKNSIKCVEILLKYGANPNTPQVYTETPLHTAAALGHRECMEFLLQHGADVRSQFGKRRLTALHLAAEDDYVECVKLLLENGAKVDARNADNQTPLHLACLAQSVETVEILIKYGADVNATYKDGRTALHAAIVKESKSFECARHLLKAGSDVNKPDNFGYTALHLAALNEFSGCVYMLLDHGADITARTGGCVSALSFIVRRTPEVIPKFLAKFDASIKVNEHEIGDVDCEIKLDFRLLVPNTERGETELLLCFIEVGKKRILKHPLCETFLFLKWRRIRKFFLFSLFYHAIFVMLFTMYILGVYDRDCLSHVDKKEDDSLTELAAECLVPKYISPVGYFVIFMNLILLGKEFFQMGHGFYGYAKYWENWVQWSIIIGVFSCTTPAMISDNLKTVPEWQHHVAAIVIFLVWVELMMLVGRFPIFGLYVQMFTKVAMNFAKFLLAYCCLLIAFGLSFGVLFNTYPAFKSIPWSLLKTVAMMAGELEFEDIFYGDVEIQYPVTSHAMFFAFVLLVTVILTNLLVGLAVSDIQGLQASAGLDRLSRQAELVARLESLFFSKLLRKAPPSFIRMCQRSALLRTSRYHLQFCTRPNDPRDTRLPRDLVVSIYKLVAERRDRNQSMRRKKREENMTYFAQSFNDSFDRIRIRNHSSHETGSRTCTKTLRPQSANNQICITNTAATLDVRNNSIEMDKTIHQFKVQMIDLSRKITELQESLGKKLEDVNKELGVVKLRLDGRI